MGSTNISFRTDESKRDELDKLATAMDRDRSWVINEAIDDYLERQRWEVEQIRKGIADSDAGRTYTTEQVRELLAKKNAAWAAKAGSDK